MIRNGEEADLQATATTYGLFRDGIRNDASRLHYANFTSGASDSGDLYDLNLPNCLRDSSTQALCGTGSSLPGITGYIGFAATPTGSLIGAAYGLVDGFIFGIVMAWIYNWCSAKCCNTKCCNK